MQQIVLVVLIGYVCTRCLVFVVQGEIRDCPGEEPRCYDVDLRLQFEQRQPPARYSFDRPERGLWIEESWQATRRSEPRELAPHLARKRARNFQLAMEPSARFQRADK
jgi:hypothetical protein